MSLSFLRHPRTTQEMRANDDPEIAEFVRAKRRANVLPDLWDDQNRGTQRSWKLHRRTRFKQAA